MPITTSFSPSFVSADTIFSEIILAPLRSFCIGKLENLSPSGFIRYAACLVLLTSMPT